VEVNFVHECCSFWQLNEYILIWPGRPGYLEPLTTDSGTGGMTTDSGTGGMTTDSGTGGMTTDSGTEGISTYSTQGAEYDGVEPLRPVAVCVFAVAITASLYQHVF